MSLEWSTQQFREFLAFDHPFRFLVLWEARGSRQLRYLQPKADRDSRLHSRPTQFLVATPGQEAARARDKPVERHRNEYRLAPTKPSLPLCCARMLSGEPAAPFNNRRPSDHLSAEAVF